MSDLTSTDTAATLTLTTPFHLPAGSVVAVDVPRDAFLEAYADSYHEWIEGVVIHMSPASSTHQRLIEYLLMLLKAYLVLDPRGRVISQPFVMRLERSFREPDLQVILNDNPHQFTETAMLGPADICVEVVSEESQTRDYGDKFAEYEAAGVREYWIIDPLRHETRFCRLQDTGRYATILPADGFYRTPLLPHLALPVASLWQDPLPDFYAIGDTVKAMFGQ